MPNILVIDTSTEACSVALQVESHGFDNQSQPQVYHSYQVAPRQHGELVLPLVDDLLKQAGIKLIDLDVIGYGRGPGAFTGLRICISIVQGLAYGANVPVVGVSTLQAMAQAAYQERGETHVLSAIDARMGEVYWGQYRLESEATGVMQLVGEEVVCAPENVTAQVAQSSNPQVAEVINPIYWSVGSGWQTYSKILSDAAKVSMVIEPEVTFPSAKAMLSLVQYEFERGKAVAAEFAQPVYLRNDVAKKKAEQGKLAK
ncbi:MAG: tRNA (adenosine(37)-N6)-threonylcarbamoyltransferase complex dimerization subunit type 1 TsaB [Kangiellaceae bacterium]|nr:tRNA (adenosine(37)-N6)-threonylcarbamoyltransferase complex dimerization subunit type 1 TsaB [Kangiellaceae bacterium]